MPYDGKVIIATDLDNDGLEAGLKKLDKGFGKGFCSAADSSSKLEHSVKNLGEALDRAGDEAVGFSDIVRGNVASQLVVGAVEELGSQVRDITTGFVESAAAVKAEGSQFEQTFGTLQDTASSAIERVADNSGILETRLNTLGSQIYAFARSSGGESTESLELMEKALQTAADGAAYYDRSLESTTEQLQSFLKGNFENDAALGLSCTETTRNAAAMELFGKKYNDLSEIQKQQTLLQMVVDAQELSGAMGQAAREADGWENVQGNLNEAWRQFSASVGAPLLENLVPAIQHVTSALLEWTNSIDWTAFSGAISGFVSVITENGPAILSTIAGIGAGFVAWNVVTMIQGVVAAVNAFRAANEGLKLSQIAVNAVMNANPIGLVVSLIAGLIAAVVTLWNTNEDFREAVSGVWDAIKGVFSSAWEHINGIVDSVKGGLGDLVAYISGTFSSAWGSAWGGIKDIFKNMVNGIISFFEGMINSVIRGLNWLVQQANKIRFSIPDWVPGIGGKSWGISIEPLNEIQIPRLATGAVIPPNREFLAVLGDQKSGTNIEAPLSTIEQAMENVLRRSNLQNRDGGTQTVVLELDRHQLGKVIYKLNREESRRIGVSLANV